jgi:regulator of sirC expression with transglutaminase-like and TPR domain
MKSQKAAMPTERLYEMVDQILIVVNSFMSYLFKAFIPADLSALYPYPPIGVNLPTTYYISILGFLGLLYFLWYSRKWGKDFFFGFTFFTFTIILVLQLVPVGNATMADRYTYIPYIGIFFIVAKFFEHLILTRDKKYYLIVPFFCFIFYSAICNDRVKIWENDEVLFSDVIDKYPENPLAYNNRGCSYLKNTQDKETESTEKIFYYKNALSDFDKALELNPKYGNAYHGRGNAKSGLGDYAGAIIDFDKALELDESVMLYSDRGNAKSGLKDYAGAIKDFDKTIALFPNADGAYFNRGNAKKDLNDYAGALKDYSKALELNPTSIEVYNNRSILRLMIKDYKGAIADYDKLIELNPEDTATIKNKEIVTALLKSKKK